MNGIESRLMIEIDIDAVDYRRHTAPKSDGAAGFSNARESVTSM